MSGWKHITVRNVPGTPTFSASPLTVTVQPVALSPDEWFELHRRVERMFRREGWSEAPPPKSGSGPSIQRAPWWVRLLSGWRILVVPPPAVQKMVKGIDKLL